jgi:hypothetical protein
MFGAEVLALSGLQLPRKKTNEKKKNAESQN